MREKQNKIEKGKEKNNWYRKKVKKKIEKKRQSRELGEKV